ncbi:MAG: alpha/beta hydrolase, partial [Bacteroidota bacterium]
HPERLQSLTLMSTVPASTEYKQQTDSIVQGRLTQEDLLERSNLVKSAAFRNGEPQAMADFFRLSFRSVLHDRTMVDQIPLELPDNFGESSKKLGNLFEDLEQIDLYPRLPAITCPALVVHGAADAVPLAAVERIAQTIPDSQLEVFSESGHFPYIEQPQAFQELMARFLP